MRLVNPIAAAACACIVAAGAYWLLRPAAKEATTPQVDASPVHAATVTRGDFPVYLSSLGQVQPWNTITVRSRVDGEAIKIAFDEGQTVKAGDLLVQIDPRPFQAALDQTLAKKSLDEALLANQQRDLQRYERVGTLANSQQQIDTQRALIAQTEAQVRSDAASVEAAQVQLAYTRITAPIAGRIGFRQIDQGNIIHASDTTPVTSIVQLEPIAVLFTEPEEELPRIVKAQEHGDLPVTALTSDNQKNLAQGKLAVIDNRVNTGSGSIQLKARFANTDHALWPGLTVATRLLVEIRHDATIVPDVAVQRGPDGLFAYVVDAGGKAQLRKLQVGPIEDGHALVEKGLEAGERVVTSGYYRVQPGAPVRVLDDAPGAKGTPQAAVVPAGAEPSANATAAGASK